VHLVGFIIRITRYIKSGEV